MKKLTKKLMALVLSLVIVLSFSVSAFAATVVPKTASVTFDASDYDADLGVLLNGASTILPPTGTEFTTLFTVPAGAVHQYQDQITVMDMTYKAAENAGVLETLLYAWDTSGYDNKPHGCYMTDFFELGTQTLAYHESSVAGQSYWTGWSWVLYVNNQKPEYYASNILVNDNDNIEWKYELVTEWW